MPRCRKRSKPSSNMSYENYRFRTPIQLKADGFTQLAGPFLRKDEWMVDNLIADANRAGKTVAFSGDKTRLEVWHRKKSA